MSERRVGPTNIFVPFHQAETAQSRPRRFEQQVGCPPQRLAVLDRHTGLTYRAPDQAGQSGGTGHAGSARRRAQHRWLLLGHDTPVIAALSPQKRVLLARRLPQHSRAYRSPGQWAIATWLARL